MRRRVARGECVFLLKEKRGKSANDIDGHFFPSVPGICLTNPFLSQADKNAKMTFAICRL